MRLSVKFCSVVACQRMLLAKMHCNKKGACVLKSCKSSCVVSCTNQQSLIFLFENVWCNDHQCLAVVKNTSAFVATHFLLDPLISATAGAPKWWFRVKHVTEPQHVVTKCKECKCFAVEIAKWWLARDNLTLLLRQLLVI